MKCLIWICMLLGILATWQAAAQTDSAETTEADEETWVKPEQNPESKIGIKLGMGISTITGSESNTNTAYLSLMGGMYYRHRIKQVWLVQTELNVSRRGSNFDNGNTEYSRIQCYFVDIPVLLMRGVSENNAFAVGGGIQYSRLINSAIFKYKDALPQPDRPELALNDVLLVAGAQYHQGFIAFQLMIKYGLINANRGLLPSLPPVSQGNSMHHFSVEFNFLF